MKPAVYLHQSKQNAIRYGHPWVFPKAIARQEGKCITGECVNVFVANGELLGVGVYNEHSLYRVRMLALTIESIDTTSLKHIIHHRLQQALALRQAINLPNEMTSAYRLFNSEADGLSGLTIDRFNQTCVISSSAYWVEMHKETILTCMREIMLQDTILWFAQAKPLKQDGWITSSLESITGVEQVLEAGVRYHVDFSNVQKTGLFLDQRENHQRVAAFARGKRVLDLYTYSGGFALHAAAAGALTVTAVDSSAQAIALAKENAKINALDSVEFIEADARDYLVKSGEYDIVILDPPKLVPSQRYIDRAKNYYRFLHREVFKAMRSGSLLMTCNCSAALSADDFTSLVSAQAMAVGKMIRILGVYGPASCHPTLASFPEGHYLTAVLLVVV